MILAMLFLVPFVNEYWFITIPEVLYLMYLWFVLLGPNGLILITIPIYSGFLLYQQVPTMVVVGVIMAIHILYVLCREIAGDKLAREKTGTANHDAAGIPRMAADSRTEGSTEPRKHHALDDVVYIGDNEDDAYGDGYGYGYDDCPNCGSGDTDGNHCYDCDEDF